MLNKLYKTKANQNELLIISSGMNKNKNKLRTP